MILKKGLFAAAVVVGVALCAGTADATEQRFITIGTGGVTGVYYPTGGAICRLVNKGRKKHGIRCSVESTGGSLYNVHTIRDGELDMAIIQSDVHFKGYQGRGSFQETGAFSGLRTIFSLFPEPFTVVARADAGITDFGDLKGKRVNIGNPGSGQRETMEVLMKELDWDTNIFAQVSELNSAEQSTALCDNRIDAMVFTVGHPNGSIKEATTSCDSVLVNVTGPAVDALISRHEYYRTATIPGGMYRGNDNDIQTYGVGATFAASTALDADVVYQVVKAIFENFEDLKKLHPALKSLEKEEMIKDGLMSPLHKGAIRYYKEAGLM